MSDNIDQILSRYSGAGRDQVIPLLQEVQRAAGYLSRTHMEQIAITLGLSAAKIYGVASFYNQFRFHQPGRFHIQVCRGTACHVKGSAGILEALRLDLKVEPGQTTKDGIFSLEVVACIGACGLAPVICIDGEFFGGMTKQRIPEILNTFRQRAKEEGLA